MNPRRSYINIYGCSCSPDIYLCTFFDRCSTLEKVRGRVALAPGRQHRAILESATQSLLLCPATPRVTHTHTHTHTKPNGYKANRQTVEQSNRREPNRHAIQTVAVNIYQQRAGQSREKTIIIIIIIIHTYTNIGERVTVQRTAVSLNFYL